MEHSLKKDPKSRHLCYSTLLVEKGARDGDGQMGAMDLLGKKALNSPFFVTAWHQMRPSSQQTAQGSGRSKSHSTFTILRNLITCGAVEINDSVMVPRHNRNKKTSPSCVGLDMCKLGRPVRRSWDPWNQHQQETARVEDFTKCADFSNLKSVPAAYRPVSSPTCSLCGKAFKPEKMHSHMKSCRGMKMVAENAATTSRARDKKSSWRSATYSDRVTDHTTLLCH